MTSFHEQVVLITGAASGIGQAAAELFARQGARLLLADMNADRGAQVAADLVQQGAQVHFVQTDVTKSQEVQAMVDAAISKFGALDVAFNNAGIEGKLGVPAGQLEEEDWNRIIAVNLSSVWLCMRAELSYMAEHGGGVIVNTSSTAGLAASVNSGVAYAASKHGVIGLTRTAAKEYAGKKIRVNALCPGGVETPLLERTIGAQAMAAAGQASPMGRICTPQEIAEAAAWLASGASSFVNGHALVVDGGRLA